MGDRGVRSLGRWALSPNLKLKALILTSLEQKIGHRLYLNLTLLAFQTFQGKDNTFSHLFATEGEEVGGSRIRQFLHKILSIFPYYYCCCLVLIQPI